MKIKSMLLAGLAVLVSATTSLFAGGTLTPTTAVQQPIKINSHQANVTINNGFAQVEVLQTFFNPNPTDLEAVYAFPVPKSASLAEVTINTGEKTLQGEVLAKKDAETVYEEEKKSGNDAGIAKKNSYQTFEFRVSPVRANSEVKLRFVYYQPLEIDSGVGRFLYPLEDGGTDEVAKTFWTTNSQVEGNLTINVELKSAWPVSDVRVPGFETAAVTKKIADGHYQVTLDRAGAKLDRDFVFYYRLADNLPGRVEVIPYRGSKDKPGTFMMVVTPGVDLKPITHGADYVYVLDVSGSMQGKIHTLASGVSQALGKMRPEDRFRIVSFSTSAREVLDWTAATPENVQHAVEVVKGLKTENSTNLFAGIQLGLEKLNADRATSLVLVTDGVANEGVVEPAAFHKLLKNYDIRVFGFLMGNSSNWPLMRTITDATGGFYAGVSNDDDIVGQLILAKSKICFEALHDASFKFSGARVFDTTGDYPNKIYRGQQLVIFGRYEGAGQATVTLKAKLTGDDKTYTTTFNFPEVDTDNPEIERLWAMAQVEQIELKENIGVLSPSESKDGITAIGVNYQIVTDHTSMVILDDATFAKRGIARNNQQRVATERAAQSVRSAQPIKNYRVDAQNPTYSAPAHHINHGGGGGGGALDAKTGNALLLLFLAAACFYARRYMRAGSQKE
ncbi:MAG: VIT and VWA domain-containing protein [Nibricoccus sp.]